MSYASTVGDGRLAQSEEDEDLEDNFIVRNVRRVLPVAAAYDGDRFFTLVDGVRTATPLLLVLVVVELSDLARGRALPRALRFAAPRG